MKDIELRTIPLPELTMIHNNLTAWLLNNPNHGTPVIQKDAQLYGIVNTPVLQEAYYEIDIYDLEIEQLLEQPFQKALASVCPMLIKLEGQGTFVAWLVEKGYGVHGVQFLYSTRNIQHLALVLRNCSLSDVQTHAKDEMQEALFHFYDSRTLYPYAQIMPGQIAQILFGSVDLWLCQHPWQIETLCAIKLKEDTLVQNNILLTDLSNSICDLETFSVLNKIPQKNAEQPEKITLNRQDLEHFSNHKAREYIRNAAYSLQSQYTGYTEKTLEEIIEIITPIGIQGFQQYRLATQRLNFSYIVAALSYAIEEKDQEYLRNETSNHLKAQHLETLINKSGYRLA